MLDVINKNFWRKAEWFLMWYLRQRGILAVGVGYGFLIEKLPKLNIQKESS